MNKKVLCCVSNMKRKEKQNSKNYFEGIKEEKRNRLEQKSFKNPLQLFQQIDYR